MSLFTFNSSIPAANNNPSVDQPDMLANNQATEGILNIDHITFNKNNGGQHKQVTFNSNNVPTGLPTDPTSILYTNAGTATNNADMFYANAVRTIQTSPIKAWAFASPGGVAASQSVNIVSITRTAGFAAGGFTVQMTANTVSGVNYAVLVSTAVFKSGGPTGTIAGYTIVDQNNFNLAFVNFGGSVFTDPLTFSFIVLQI